MPATGPLVGTMITRSWNISTAGLSGKRPVTAGSERDSPTAAHTLAHARPYRPALKAGPAMRTSTSVSRKVAMIDSMT
jgi:hypothetical protein